MSADEPLQPAYVLHRRPYRNTSLLLELFTRELGRFPAVAKGARSGAPSVSALLQPFTPLLVSCSGRGEVRTLRRFDAGDTPPVLRGTALYCGFYLNELLMRLSARYDVHPEIFDRYGDALGCIAHSGTAEPCLRRFEVRLLEGLGYGLQLSTVGSGGTTIDPAKRYRYEVEVGPKEDPQGAYSGRTLLALAGAGPGDESELRESRALMRSVLGHYLGERPLKSRELFGPH